MSPPLPLPSSTTSTNLCRLVGVILIIQFTLTILLTGGDRNFVNAQQQQHHSVGHHQSTPSLFARILQQPANISRSIVADPESTKEDARKENELNDEPEDDEEDEDDDEDEDGEEDEDEEKEDDDVAEGQDGVNDKDKDTKDHGDEKRSEPHGDKGENKDGAKTDELRQRSSVVSGRTLAGKLEHVDDDKRALVPANGLNKRLAKSSARDLGMFALKAMLLGPLIGLGLKAALIRGLLYALLAYAAHLFFPSLLGALGLGTGLVGFARQLQPNYAQLLIPHLVNLQQSLPNSFTKLAGQYQQVLAPVVDSIRAIPEGHCRFRAVCETASQLIRQSRSMSVTLQRISATVYTQFGSDYSKAWLDGIVQSDCAAKYAECPMSPFSLVAGRLAQALGARDAMMPVGAAAGGAAAGAAGGAVAELGQKI